MTGTTHQIQALEEYLNSMEVKGNFVYGLHIANASIMSCYVEDRKSKHAHFIDGSEGGYTQAAVMLKTKSN